MTTTYLLDQIIEQGIKVRNLQNRFFSTPQGEERKQLLRDAKEAETKFDALLMYAQEARRNNTLTNE